MDDQTGRLKRAALRLSNAIDRNHKNGVATPHAMHHDMQIAEDLLFTLTAALKCLADGAALAAKHRHKDT